MSLAVWLPLNGDLHNQGLSSTTFSGTAAYKSYGKLGGQSLSLQNRIICSTPALNGVQFFSIAFWCRIEANPDSTADFMDIISFTDQKSDNSANGQFRFETGYFTDSQGGIHWHDNTTNAIINGFNTYNAAAQRNEWHHIVVTIADNSVKSYYDGALQNTQTTSLNKGHLTGSWWIGESTTRGCIQDVRIYNHALSSKEVEEISKGLILHYPLNNNGLGNTNLALNTFYEMRPYTISSYYTRINNSTDFFNLSVGDTYTCRAKITAGEKDTRLRIQFYTNNNTRTSIFGNWITAGTTGYSTITSTLTAEQRNYSQMQIYLDDGVNASTSGEYGELKLEKGSIATPWCPNNINTNIIYDTSGYCNNGIVVGDIATITPSPRYNCCIEHLDSCADYIYREYLSFLGDSGFTFSCWINPTSYSRTTNTTTAIGTQFILSQGRDTITSGTNNTRGASLIIYNGKPQFFCGNGSLSSNTTIPIGEWAHVVGVWTGTQRKIYVNGILKNSANDTGIDWIEAQNSLVIGKMAYYKNSTSSFHPFVGKISDVRIYATALTDNQIKELYNTSMQIDSSGNVFARELVEL